MAWITDQSVPSELADAYAATLNSPATGAGGVSVRTRVPFRRPQLQGCRTIRPPIIRGSWVSDAQCAHRHVFGDCVKCYNKQPQSGGATPPDVGPRNRSWWYDEAIGSGLWYYDYFMQQTINAYTSGTPPEWCIQEITGDTWVHSEAPNHNFNTEKWLAVANQTLNGLKRTYIQIAEESYDSLWLYLYGWSGPDWDDQLATIRVYEAAGEWDAATITWNNQPGLGDHLSSKVFYLSNNQWIKFDTGGKKSIVLTLPDPSLVINFRASNADQTTQRPMWAA